MPIFHICDIYFLPEFQMVVDYIAISNIQFSLHNISLDRYSSQPFQK